MVKIKLPIISGQLKSRRIEITKDPSLRPMLTRARCTMFDILFNFLSMESVRALDICAGSGILGIEAISRGAQKVVFFEINKKVCGELETNLNKLGVLDKSRVINTNAFFPGENQEEPFHLVFLDLPYKSTFLTHKILKKFLMNRWIDINTLFVIAMSKQEKFETEVFIIEQEKIVSNTKILFLRYIPFVDINE